MVTVDHVEQWCGHKTVPFHYGHIALMSLGKEANEIKESIPNYMKYMQSMTEKTPSFTVMDKGKLLLSFGIYPLWPGVAEGWMIPSNCIDSKAIALIKGARNVFRNINSVMQLHRLQFMVRSSHVQAARFAEVLQFKREAVLSRYGPGGDDYYIYARFY
jgi:hypothetical protein